MRELGVGLVYWPPLAPLFEAGQASVLELEPQTLWRKTSHAGSLTYQLNEEQFESIARLPQAKLLHGVGQPLAGTVDDPIDPIPLLDRMTRRLDPAWVSEHLSVSRIRRHGQVTDCGLLLPPAQTLEAARVAARNIQRYSAALGRPAAFETGVNYLRPIAGQLEDGEFFAAVAELANCGILLDVHNLWCNQRNGRQRACDAVSQMPLERIWELHFAGGEPLDGLWLDAHSGAIPADLIEFTAELMPRLAGVGALIFEILPEHLGQLGLDGVQRQLEQLASLWRLRPARGVPVTATRSVEVPASTADLAAASAWERRLVDVLDGIAPHDPLSADPGCPVVRQLIRDGRSASLARGLRLTSTALLAGLGPNATHQLLDAYFTAVPPDTFVAMECVGFTRFLAARADVMASVPYLDEILAFESALLRASVFGETTDVRWTVDPTALIESLETGRLPDGLPSVESRMTISV